MLSRRKVLTGLIAAPAIVSFGSIMPVRGEVLKSRFDDKWIPSWMRSFMEFQSAPYYDRMALGVPLGGPVYAQQQIMQFREMSGHIMGPDLRRYARYEGRFRDHHDEHLRQQIREALHATRLKNQA